MARISASISVFFSLSCLLWFLGALAFGVFDGWSLVLFVGLGAVAWNEHRGATQLAACVPTAPARLALGQVFLGGLVIVYCAWALVAATTGPGLVSRPHHDRQMAEMLAGYEELAQLIAVAVYGSAVVLTVIFQGLGALYYLSKRRAIRGYVAGPLAGVPDAERSRSAHDQQVAA